MDHLSKVFIIQLKRGKATSFPHRRLTNRLPDGIREPVLDGKWVGSAIFWARQRKSSLGSLEGCTTQKNKKLQDDRLNQVCSTIMYGKRRQDKGAA